MPLSREEIQKLHRDHSFYPWSAQASVGDPVVMASAKGVYFWDHNGKKYIDFSSQLMNMNVGHGHPRIIQAVKDQVEQLAFVYPQFSSEIKGLASQKLAQLAPGDLNKVLWTLGGAESVENAIKIARTFTGRHKIVTRYRSFHGAGLGSLALGGDPRRLPHEPTISGVVRVHDPYAYRCPFGYAPEGNTQVYIDHVIQTMEFEGPETIAAIMMEAVTGSSGLLVPPPGYWEQIAEYCRKKGILVIADEVMSGFGRTGKMFAMEHFNVVPDIMVVAKGLTCGYVPMGAVIVNDRISKHFDTNALVCGLTYSGHPVGCAAALATMNVYAEDNLVENARVMGESMSRHMHALKEKHPSVGDVRSIGLFGVLEIVKNRKTREPMAPWNAKASEMGAMAKVAARLKEQGLSTFVRWNWVFAVPPLCINEAEMAEGMAMIDDALNLADAAYEG